MMVTENLHLRRRILGLIALEHDATVLPGNEHLPKSNILAVRCMISPDVPTQIVLSQIPCQRAVKGLGKADVERARYQSEIRQTLQRLQQGRVGHALGAEPSAWNHDTSIGFPWASHLPTLSALRGLSRASELLLQKAQEAWCQKPRKAGRLFNRVPHPEMWCPRHNHRPHKEASLLERRDKRLRLRMRIHDIIV